MSDSWFSSIFLRLWLAPLWSLDGSVAYRFPLVSSTPGSQGGYNYEGDGTNPIKTRAFRFFSFSLSLLLSLSSSSLSHLLHPSLICLT